MFIVKKQGLNSQGNNWLYSKGLEREGHRERNEEKHLDKSRRQRKTESGCRKQVEKVQSGRVEEWKADRQDIRIQRQGANGEAKGGTESKWTEQRERVN